MQLLLIGLGLYLLTSKPGPAQQQQQQQQKPQDSSAPGSNFATELGAFVGGLIGSAAAQYGQDDTP